MNESFFGVDWPSGKCVNTQPGALLEFERPMAMDFLCNLYNHESLCLLRSVLIYFRLQYVGQRCQMYIKQIKMALDEKSGKDEEYKVKVIALRTTSNIHSLIKVR